MYPRSDIPGVNTTVITAGVNAVAQENEQQIVLGIRPDEGASIATMPKAG